MERREFLTLVAGTAITTALAPTLGRARTPSFEAQTVQGTVMPTLGNVTGTSLPLNGPAEGGVRYRPRYRFGMGGTQIGNIFAPMSDAQAQAALSAAWDGGVRHFDTSPFYGHGLSEHRLGTFLRGKPRDEYLVSTKVGRVFKASREPLKPDFWADKLNFSYEYAYTAEGARRSVEDSLQRMGFPASTSSTSTIWDLKMSSCRSHGRALMKLLAPVRWSNSNACVTRV